MDEEAKLRMMMTMLVWCCRDNFFLQLKLLSATHNVDHTNLAV